jgi:hypothetical protein
MEELNKFIIYHISPWKISKYQLGAFAVMHRFLRMLIIMVITFAVIIGLFFFVLPMTDIPDQIGPSYFIVALIGSLVISYFVSWGLQKLWK